MIAAALAALTVAAAPAPGDEDLLAGLQLFRGHCSSVAHTSEGPSDSDLGTRQRPMTCGRAVLTTPNGDPRRAFWQFSIKDYKGERVLGFSGERARGLVKVDRVYASSAGEYEVVTDGICRAYTKGIMLSGVMCASMVDHRGYKRVNVVTFDADPGQPWH